MIQWDSGEAASPLAPEEPVGQVAPTVQAWVADGFQAEPDPVQPQGEGSGSKPPPV
ncbi:MAG: hypothetical protein WAR57_14825 [Candidatus Phosphoribacter sp.]